MKRTIIRTLLLALVLCASASHALAFNVYLPPKSPWTDDEILVYGDGAPVYMTLGELKLMFRPGPKQTVARQQSGLSRFGQSFVVDLSGTLGTYVAELAPVPEPTTPALVVMAAALLVIRRALRSPQPSRP